MRFQFSVLAALLFCMPIILRSGECLDSRETMLEDYRKGVREAISHPQSADYDLGPWIENCWYSWDPRHGASHDDELADELLLTLANTEVPAQVKAASYSIGANAAPLKLLTTLPPLMEAGMVPTKYQLGSGVDGVNILLNIWARYGNKNPDVAKFDYFALLKKFRPLMFQIPCDDITDLLSTLAVVYRFDYPSARTLLERWELQPCTPYGETFHFMDPRAFEDTEFQYGAAKKHAPISKEDMFFALAGHLELEFKREWLDKLEKYQLRMLRNGILATYGYEVKNRKLHSYFATGLGNFCRSGECGRISDHFDFSMLNDVDRKNITLIQQMEK